MWRHGPRLNEEGTFGIDARLSPVVFNAAMPLVAEKVESQAIVLEIGNLQELSPQLYPLVILQGAFENRILNALPVILANPCNPAKTSRAIGGDRRNIVADENEHGSQRHSNGG